MPAYQSALTLGAVVSDVRAVMPELHVIVVDDGSTDGTHAVATQYADDVIAFGRNRGKGIALREGLARALDAGARTVITMDADGQHDAHYIGRLLDALHGYDIAIGARSRWRSPMPLARRITNGLSSAVMSWCAGQKIIDGQSGFRAFRAEILPYVMNRASGARYEYESAFLLCAARAGYRMTFVPVPTLYPRGGQSHFRAVRDTARVAGTIGRSVVYLR